MKRVFGEQAIAKLNAVSLSDNTIKRRIEEMSDNIADQILAEIKESKFGFAIQLDESTNITNYCQLLVYVRYAQTNIMETELLLNHEVSTTTKGKNIFDILDSFFKKNGLDWKNLVGCTTDELPQCLFVGLVLSRMLKLFRQMSRLFIVLFIGSPYVQKCCLRSC